MAKGYKVSGRVFRASTSGQPASELATNGTKGDEEAGV
jgi:hypothetical protein